MRRTRKSSSPAAGGTSWGEAAARLSALYGQLDSTGVPADRAALYERIASAEEAAVRGGGLDVMPPLEAGEGTTYAQAYADAARLCRILAAGERSFGRMPMPGLAFGVALPGVPREHFALWGRYLGATDRAGRADLLITLYELTAATAGSAGAAPLSRAASSEQLLARPARTAAEGERPR